MSDDLNNDYEKIRSSLYDLTDQGSEAIELMMDLARESEHPRAFEVLGQLIKQNADISEKILKLHKTKKEITDKVKSISSDVVNNNLFIGSTAELQKMLRDENVIDVESSE